MNKEKYDHSKIEKKWQDVWKKAQIFKTKFGNNGKNFYCLDMFPYPSGQGLHVGHPRGYTATDVYARYMRMKGFCVLHPMGWDAFGLPAENYAIRNKIHPSLAVRQNIQKFKKQISSFGFSYDWSREINTTDPDYYKWTQWIFLKLFKRGLAYESDAPINWCPSCKTGLANEEVVNGKCERCGKQTESKKIRQWILKITQYADQLLKGLDDLDWPESIKTMQRKWIGKSEGATIKFQIINNKLQNSNKYIEVFTTRADTLYGCTYLVVAPEYFISNLKAQIDALTASKPKSQFIFENLTEIERYCAIATKQLNIDKQHFDKNKTGVEIKGIKAINPINQKEIPIFVSDYVLNEYGTGAIMAVPAHDARDFEFAKKYNLPVIDVIQNDDTGILPFLGEGKIKNSNEFNEFSSNLGAKQIILKLKKQGLAQKHIQYKLRDWIFSRQRYWGEPIPVIHCPKCGVVPVPEKDLPVLLPSVKSYEPIGTGESPLANIREWVNTKCPSCSGDAQRETNTMPQWAGSCWYYLAYLAKNNSKFEILNSKLFNNWLPVNLYVGGAEHAVLHLLYVRFWHKVLFDEKIVGSKEPFQKLINVGMIVAPNGQKMSKSRGNVISPDDLIKKYGADSLRLTELFIGPFSQSIQWNKNGIIGMRKFLERIISLKSKISPKSNQKIENGLNKMLVKVDKDIKSFQFNTAISAMMIFVNLSIKEKSISKGQYKKLLAVLSPFAPHITQELWSKLGKNNFICQQAYPSYKHQKKEQIINIPVQINGKLRGEIKININDKKEFIIECAKNNPKIKLWVNGKIIKTIYIPLKIINFVVK